MITAGQCNAVLLTPARIRQDYRINTPMHLVVLFDSENMDKGTQEIWCETLSSVHHIVQTCEPLDIQVRAVTEEDQAGLLTFLGSAGSH